MDTIGYLLLGLIGFIAVKAFGGASKSDPFSQGQESKTGALIIDSSLLTQPVARFFATRLQDGSYYCPMPTKLFKDSADGKYYCYNPADFDGAYTVPAGVDLQPTMDQLTGGSSFTGVDLQPTIRQLTGDPYGNTNSMIVAPAAVPDVVQGDSQPDGQGTIPAGGYLA